MKYLLDTNICIYLIKHQPAQVFEKFLETTAGEIGVSTVTIAEMSYGAEKSANKERNRSALELFLAPLEVVEFDLSAAKIFGVIRSDLEKKGTPIGAYDLMIAAQASSLGITLVTNNEREFRRIPNLMVENWIL